MIYSITDWPAVSLVCNVPVTRDVVRINPSLLFSLQQKEASNVSRVETAQHRLKTDHTASPVILVLLLSKWSCRAWSERKTTSSEESSCVRAAGPLLLCDGASTDSARPLGVGNVCKKCEEPVLSLAVPIWEPHPNTNVGAILVFQASKLDLSLLWSASVYWSHSRTSLTAAYLAELNIRFEDGEVQRCGKKKGRLGWSLFPSCCEDESDPFPDRVNQGFQDYWGFTSSTLDKLRVVMLTYNAMNHFSSSYYCALMDLPH